jgi:hypothetical protein
MKDAGFDTTLGCTNTGSDTGLLRASGVREMPFDSSLGFITSCKETIVEGGEEYALLSGFASIFSVQG